MTDIGVYTIPVSADDLSWDITPDMNTPYAAGGTLDVSLFTQSQHFAKGYIPSGTVLGKVTATDLYGPYLDTATDGRQTAVGITRAAVMVVQPYGEIKTKVGAAIVKALAAVDAARLPFTSGNAAGGGFLDANGRADLPLIHFEN